MPRPTTLRIHNCIGLLIVCLFLVACGNSAESLPPTPTPTAQIRAGITVFKRECASCHALVADTVKVGPSLHNIATRAATRIDNTSAEAYILQSIMNPTAYTVAGFDSAMPLDLSKKLTGEEIDAVVAYLMTQTAE
jgi:cytochrome c551/c552